MTYVEDTESSGRPSTTKTYENVARMKKAVFENTIIIHEVANTLGISSGSAHKILKVNQMMRWIAAKLSPVPIHSALSVRKFATKSKMTVVPHPPYSPDLAPYDFFLLPELRKMSSFKYT